tara:strand:+ start:4409 stop:4906 length:498 start_codon:yes stop_codon:yes gene_type:complete
MSDELEVQVINSPHLTLEVDIKSIIEEHVTEAVGEYLDNYDWYSMLSDHNQTISEIANEDIDVHDQVHDVVNAMDFIKSEDLDDDVANAIRNQLRQFNGLGSLSDACSLGDAFIEAVQKIANVTWSKVDMERALRNQFANATIKLEFNPVSDARAAAQQLLGEQH